MGTTRDSPAWLAELAEQAFSAYSPDSTDESRAPPRNVTGKDRVHRGAFKYVECCR